MGTKVKGLLKGLRHISHIFDEKEDQITIGFPTDVKHVAHIGSDGPSTNQPSWMNEFKSSEASSVVDTNEVLSSQGSFKTVSEYSVKNISHELLVRNEIPKARRKSSSNTNSPLDSPKRVSDGSKHSRRNRTKVKDNSTDALATHESSGTTRGSGRSKHSRRNRSVDCSSDPVDHDNSMSTQGSSDGSKHSRRNHSTDGSIDTQTKDSSKRSSRRNRSIDVSNDSQTEDSSNSAQQSKIVNPESESPTQETQVLPKQSRRKKSDGSTKGKSSRSKEHGSLTDIQLDNGSMTESKNNLSVADYKE